ncbi:unnamed protein product, partial [Ectocarpus sp. 8 AP-2014]
GGRVQAGRQVKRHRSGGRPSVPVAPFAQVSPRHGAALGLSRGRRRRGWRRQRLVASSLSSSSIVDKNRQENQRRDTGSGGQGPVLSAEEARRLPDQGLNRQAPEVTNAFPRLENAQPVRDQGWVRREAVLFGGVRGWFGRADACGWCCWWWPLRRSWCVHVFPTVVVASLASPVVQLDHVIPGPTNEPLHDSN